MSKQKITLDELAEGEYAEVARGEDGAGTIVMSLSRTCFQPINNCAYTVNISTGIGSYPKHTRCFRLTRAEALARAAYLNGVVR